VPPKAPEVKTAKPEVKTDVKTEAIKAPESAGKKEGPANDAAATKLKEAAKTPGATQKTAADNGAKKEAASPPKAAEVGDKKTAPVSEPAKPDASKTGGVKAPAVTPGAAPAPAASAKP
jgi:hypothetical protein